MGYNRLMLKVALIGRPNVGKSTLFNRLVGRDVAIVSRIAGTTRDVRDRKVAFKGREFLLLDTAGWERAKKDAVAADMSRASLAAAGRADLIVFIADARAPLATEDLDFARMIRKTGKPVIFVANKAENQRDCDLHGFERLGFGPPLPISAEHNLGIGDLLSAIAPYADEPEESEEEAGLPLRLAIIGRPNVGKSTLVNALLGTRRMLTGELAGITRDSVDTDFSYEGRDIRLVDTAGLRRKSRVEGELEKLSTARSIEAVKNSDVCAIVLDATQTLDSQDLKVANLALGEGKGLLFALNKIDAARDKKAALAAVRDRLAQSFPQIKAIPVVPVSAARASGLAPLMREVFKIGDLRSVKIPTARLNKWLAAAVGKQPPPMSRLKRPMRLKYMTQVGTKPLSFAIFAGGASDPPESYLRYLENSLKKEFGLESLAVRLAIRINDNPYKEEKS